MCISWLSLPVPSLRRQWLFPILTAALLTGAIPLPAQFFLNGDAVRTNDTCYQLTYDRNFSVGSIWNPDKIDLRRSFDVVVNVNLGCKDADGADGIVFGFQPVSTSIGTGGEGIGFLGIVPSLGIELDTWQNGNLNDPVFDHLAIIRNGNLNHGSGNTLAGPAPVFNNAANAEDCRFHELRVSWDAGGQLLEVFFDCSLRLSYRGDLVRDIFRGDPLVFWGFTSATGGANNIHQVCLTYTTFLDQLPDVVMCPGGQVQLKARGGVAYRWSPAAGLSAPDAAFTFASPDTSTTYTVEIEDECGRIFFDEVRVDVAGDSVFFDLGPDTALCAGDALRLDVTTPTATYFWEDANTDGVRLITQPGYYAVTVTRTDTFCIANDEVFIQQIPRPEVDLGTDTILCNGQQIVLRAPFPAGTTTWQDGSTADTLLVSRPGRYRAVVANRCGAVAGEIDVAYDACDEAYIPNAFSPNDDGVNDRLTVYHGGDVRRVIRLLVFSRWGELLYQDLDFLPDDAGGGWDGRSRGQPMPQGVYLYVADLEFRDGTTARRTGEVHLVR